GRTTQAALHLAGAGPPRVGRDPRVVVRSGLRDTPDTDGVLAVAVPVADVDLVAGPAEEHGHVRRATAQGVLHVVLLAAAHREGVLAVPVPVTGLDLVGRPAVGEHHVRAAAARRVL